ncbi:MAG: hypothetical protein ACLQU1_26485 [Bryobacteraceae bacterium]
MAPRLNRFLYSFSAKGAVAAAAEPRNPENVCAPGAASHATNQEDMSADLPPGYANPAATAT